MKYQYIKNVSTLILATDKCTGCGRCVEVCPHQVFVFEGKKAMIVNKDSCMECGACAQNCAFDVIKVNSGVGCAYAVIKGWFTGAEASCDCSADQSSESC
jgi:NAD-dependent dihydropyrimidine dehydrogenase PreA subunit